MTGMVVMPTNVVGDGLAYQPGGGNPPPAQDPFFSSVVSLVHGTGSNGGTSFPDVKGLTWTPGGVGMVTTTAQSLFSQTGVMDFHSGGFLRTTAIAGFGFGTGDFTVELWVFMLSGAPPSGQDGQIADFRTASAQNGMFYFAPVSANKAIYYNGANQLTSNTTAVAPNVWTHVAYTRQGSLFSVWIGGTLGASQTMAGDFTASRPCSIGANFAGTANFNGYAREWRVTKGVCRYTATFNPPTTPFPDS